MRAIINTGDGSVAIMQSAKGELTSKQVARDMAILIADKRIPAESSVRMVAVDKLPQSRTFRDAWTDDQQTDTVDVDLSRAQGIAHGIRREVRAGKFAPLDAQAIIPAEASAAEIGRQKVRDDDAVIQSNIDRAKDVETLEAVIVGYV